MVLSNILPYTVQAYRDFYNEDFITGFTHASIAKGQIDPAQSLQFVEKLNAEACQVIPSVSFNHEMLSGTQLEGGACSAVAFRVAKEALSQLKNLSENHQLRPSHRDVNFALRFYRFINHLEERVTSKRAPDKAFQIMIRSEQAALNTITVNREKVSGNAVSEKISAMASFYGLKTVKSSPELRVKGNEQIETQLLEQLGGLEVGVYLLRIIQEKYNHKLEEKGHSIIYIKTAGEEYYFDPALGAYVLFPLAKIHLIYNALLSANERFGVDVLSFHKLEEKAPTSLKPLEE